MNARVLFPLFFIFLFTLPYSIYGQDTEEGEGSDSLVFRARSDSVWAYLSKNLDTAERYARINLQWAKKEAKSSKLLLGIAYGDMGAVYMRSGEYEKALSMIRKNLELDRKEKDSSGIAGAHLNLGLSYSKLSRYDSAVHHYEKAIELSREIGKLNNLPRLYNNLGNVYRMRSHYVKGLRMFQKGLRIADSLEGGEEDVGKGTLLGNIGTIHKKRGEWEKALKNYRAAKKSFQEKGETAKAIATHISIGDVLKEMGDTAKAMERYRKGYRFFKKSGIRGREALALIKIGSLHQGQGRLDSAIAYFKQAQAISEKTGSLRFKMTLKDRFAEIHVKKGRYEKALRLAEEGYSTAKRMRSRKWKKAFASTAYHAHKELENFREALSYHEEASQLKDSLKNEEKAEKMARMEMRYKFEKEQIQDSLQHEKEMRIQQEEIEKQRTVRNFLLGGGAVLILFLFLLYDRFRVARKRTREVEEKKKEVDHAYDQLQEKNDELQDSIHYASRIQSAILTSSEYFQNVLGDHFVFFKPKEVVSGDFYWSFGDDRYAVWLAADCTGHGVPGAFMSMIGNRLFNEVVVEQGERDPGRIFEKVRTGIIEALEQGNESETKDGMDAALCVYDRKKKRLHFSGAQNPLYIVQKAEEEAIVEGKVLEESEHRLIEVKGDRSPIGRDPDKEEAFRTNSIDLKGPVSLYTFSDGFPDQFGGPKGKKYRYKPFKRLLLSLQDKSMQEQQEALEAEFEGWKGDREQIDDVVVIGVRLDP